MTAGNSPVLETIGPTAGGQLDDGCGGVFSHVRKELERSDVRHIFLHGGLVEAADAPLSLKTPGTVWVEWAGESELFSTKPDASGAAHIRPISDGLFTGGCSIEFWACTPAGVLPMPGHVVVTNHTRFGLSPVDRIRAAAGVPTTEDASPAELEKMDEQVSRFLSGDLYLRCARGLGTNPIGTGATNDGWRT